MDLQGSHNEALASAIVTAVVSDDSEVSVHRLHGKYDFTPEHALVAKLADTG